MKKLLLCLLAAMALSGNALAVTFNVTRTDDPAPDGCSVNDCSLREAVIDADDTAEMDVISVPAGTYLIDFAGGVDNTEQTGALKISSDMEIVGAPSVIDGQNLGRIMRVTGSANVTLRNLTLQNANSSLATNNAQNGGAIEADGDSLRLFDVTFLNNNTQSLGGALRVFDSSLVEIHGCLFQGNHATNGAAIHASTGISVRNTVFENNHADGGALGSGPVAYLTGSTSDSLFERVRFEGNSSNGNGGGVYFGGRGLVVDVLVATDNEAVGGTGGVFFVFGAHAKEVAIANARFSGNMAKNGGVIGTSNDLDSISIAHSGFVHNQATAGSGGALYMTGGMVDVINDTFSGNQASANGGAVYLFGGDLKLHHATLADNTANAGDAIYVLGTANVSVIELANNVVNGACQVSDPDSVTSLGGNVEGPGDSCELGAGSDLVGQADMQLGLQPLRVNYQATPTHELLPGSAARGQGEPAVCMDVEVDQLFLDRDLCNSGAVESEVIFKDSVESSKFEI